MTEQEKALLIKNDTLSLLLCNRMNEHLGQKQQAIKVAKCCKIVRDRTKDDILYNACRSVIKAVSQGAYEDAVKSMYHTESNYLMECKL